MSRQWRESVDLLALRHDRLKVLYLAGLLALTGGLTGEIVAAQSAPIGVDDGGVAIGTYASGQLSALHTLPVGSKLSQSDGTGWALEQGTRILLVTGDVDGDGRNDIFAWSPSDLALLGFQPPQRGVETSGFRLVATVRSGARAGSWQVDTTGQILHGIGDFDGDRRGELVMTGPNAIGLLSLSGGSLISIAMHVNGSRLGGWIIDTPKNRIEGLGDFNGDGRTDILITSGWGIGILTLGEKGLTSVMLKPNGTRFGGWLYDSRVNPIQGIGDFNGDGRDDILLTSGWGIGVLTLAGDTLSSLMLKPNGTRFGGWLYDSGVNSVRGIGDFDGNGRDDFLITSGWGIGMLTLAGDSFDSLMLKPKGTRFGGWLYGVENEIGGVGDADGNGRDDFVIRSGWGVGLLTLAGDTLNSLAMHPYGTDLGLWVLSNEDRIPVVAGLAGQKADALLFHRDGPPPAAPEPTPTAGLYPSVVQVRAPESVVGGTTFVLTVVLDMPTEKGLSVLLKSSRPDLVPVPERLAFDAGASTAAISLASTKVAEPSAVEISAQLILESGASGARATIRIDPAPLEEPVSSPPVAEPPEDPTPAPAPKKPLPVEGPAYLMLEGITGQVTEPGYEGQIRIIAWQWVASRSSDGATSGERSGTAGPGEIRLTAYNGRATPKLIEAVTTGRHAANATLTVIDPANGLPAYRIEMADVQVIGFETGSAEGEDRPETHIELGFGSASYR